MDWAGSLRSELRSRAKAWAGKNGLPHYMSLGSQPTVLFEPAADHSIHGNFHPAAWGAICASPEWARRLNKPHSRKQALPEQKRPGARELDSSNSSDALLMNCFCFPGAAASILEGISLEHDPSPPLFGFAAGLYLENGALDATEIDMKIGGLIVEAKLTEADFTSRPETHLFRYGGLQSCFEVDSLLKQGDSTGGYQLIRNVLAASQHKANLIILIDQRRPDLLQEWWRVHATIRDTSLRLRCGFRTWQQIAAASPPALREFLQEKYGL